MKQEKILSSLLSVPEATHRLLEHFAPLEGEILPLAGAGGRVLAQAMSARFDLPPFPNSSMDGFAVQAADTRQASQEAPVVLAVVGDIPAGTAPAFSLQAGQAARIMTGAVLPTGAEAVAPVEITDFNYRSPGAALPEQVKIYSPVKSGENVRPRGQDVRAGETVLQPGCRLRAQDLGFLAMLGASQVAVHRLPRVALFSTGDELLSVHEPLAAGKIYDANSYILQELIQGVGATTLNLGIVPDIASAVQARLDEAVSAGADLILSSAGVSVGAFDFVRQVVEAHGRLEFWRVNMRPGKPLAFGHYRDLPFIGLPGNPVSAFVGFEVFVRPALGKLSGLVSPRRPVWKVRLGEPVDSDGRESYLRAVVAEKDGERIARLTGHQGSGNLRSLVQANALLLIPSGVKFLPAGVEVDAWLLEE
jgi:molybdopterin molybdotransferase